MSYANNMSTSTAVPPNPTPAHSASRGHEEDRSQAELASVLRLSVMRLGRRLRKERSDESLTPSQMAALGTLERHGPLTPRELAAHEKIEPPSMTRILAGLEALGLVDRAPHPRDGRQVLMSLTPAARQMVDEDRRRRDAWLARQLHDLTPAERETLRSAAEILGRLAGS
jgi:DNA-binding MarR family transcriptional regulator